MPRALLCCLLLLALPLRADTTAQLTLRVAGVLQPPFVYLEDGEVTGLIVEMVRAAGERAGLEVSFELIPWQRAVKKIQDGKADAIIPTLYKKERESLVYFSPTPLHQVNFVAIASAHAASVYNGDINSLKNNTFMQLRGASIGPRFDKLVADGEITPVLANNYLGLTRMIAAGRVDYAVMPHLAALYYQQFTGLPINLLKPFVDNQFIFMAFSRTSDYPAELRERWNQAIADLAADQTLASIEARYLQRLQAKPTSQ